ncbi:NAD(P)-binding protein [Melanogaster broomeanus]|nr:NAD(P)-binding protein [Melanogaster broomeanus]
MSGKVVLVTGGTAGIGKETARRVASPKARPPLTELKSNTGRDAHLLLMDLANLKSIKAAADDSSADVTSSKETQLNVLFNNAGVMTPPIDQLTDDGYDLQFGTNVLGHFYFTKLVLPVLLSTAKSAPDGIARVSTPLRMVTGSESSNSIRGGMDLHGKSNRESHCMDRARRSGNIIFSAELKRRYGDQGIVSTSLNPGQSLVYRRDRQRDCKARVCVLAVVEPPRLMNFTGSYHERTQSLITARTSPKGEAMLRELKSNTGRTTPIPHGPREPEGIKAVRGILR